MPLVDWKSLVGTLAITAAGAFSVGCGTSPAYEPEYPQQYQYTAPPPPTAAELAAQQEAHAQASTESREVLIGGDADEYSDTDPSALTEFKPALDGHGAWVQDSTYGTVWVPASTEVGSDFQPYVTAGHWTYSDSTDYVWVSDYDWGWAPFHYGRWVYLPNHGWSWIPGRRYAGAWVVWRTGPVGYGYVGWAPAAPDWYWYNGYAVGWSFHSYHYYDHYVYCSHNHIYHGGVSGYVVRGAAGREHYGRTHDYVPSSPGVGGGGGGRVVASPSVGGGGDRVVASPSVGGTTSGSGGAGHLPAHPTVAKGPRPDELGMKSDTIVAPPANHQGLSRAQAYSLPKTAVAAGAAPPSQVRPASASMMGVTEPTGPSSNPQGRGPASAAFVPRPSQPIGSPTAPTGPTGPSSFGERSAPIHSATTPVATAPQYRSPNGATVTNPPRYSSGASSMAPSSAPPSSFRSSEPRPSTAPPSFSQSTAPPSFRSSEPRPSSPSFHSSTPSSSPPSSFRSSSPTVSAPPSSFRSSASSISPSRSPSPSVSPPIRSTSPAVQSPVFRSSSPPSTSTPSSGAHRSGTFKKR